MMTSEPKERLAWIDVGKGLIICFIIFQHSALFFARSSPDATPIIRVVDYCHAAGMPFFFAVSGMLSAKYIHLPWKDFWSRRVQFLVWPFLVWTVLERILAAAFPGTFPVPNGGLAGLPLAILMPRMSVLWFIWSLIICHLIARALLLAPRPLAAAGSLLASAIMLGLSGWHLRKYGLDFLADNDTIRKTVIFFFFFFGGAAYKEQLLSLSRNSAWLVVLLMGMWVGLAALWTTDAGVLHRALVGTAINVSAGLAAMLAFKIISRAPPARAVFSTIGTAALPLYFMHMLVLWLLAIASNFILVRLAASIAAPLPIASLLAAAGLLCTVALARISKHRPILWLFAPPGRRKPAELASRPVSLAPTGNPAAKDGRA